MLSGRGHGRWALGMLRTQVTWQAYLQRVQQYPCRTTPARIPVQMQHFAGTGKVVMANLWLLDSGRLRAASEPRVTMGKSGRRDKND